MADQTPEEILARVTNYEEGMEEIAQGLERGTVPLAEAAAVLRALIGLPGQEHLKALRDHEASILAMMHFKDWALREATAQGCPKCSLPEGLHETNCPIETAINVQAQVSILDVKNTVVERMLVLQASVASYLAAVSEVDDPGEGPLAALKAAYRSSRQLL